MEKLQILNNIQKYGIMSATVAIFSDLLTLLEESAVLDFVFSAAAMIFWYICIKNVALLYEYKNLQKLNIISTIMSIVSSAGFAVFLRYIPHGIEATFFESMDTWVVIGVAFVIFAVIILFVVSIPLLLIVTYKLAKITKSKLFMYYFYAFILYLIYIILALMLPAISNETVALIFGISLSLIFIYALIRFHDENKKHQIA